MSCDKCNDNPCGCGYESMRRAFEGDYSKSLAFSTGFKPFDTSRENDIQYIDDLSSVLPDVDYILDSIVNYMFTNSLTTKDRSDNEQLYSFLYKQNVNGQRNLDVLKSVAKGYRKYGYYGLYYSKETDGLFAVHPKNISAVVKNSDRDEVIREIASYVVYRDGVTGGLSDRIKANRLKDSTKEGVIEGTLEELKEDGMKLVSHDEFACVRLDGSQVFGTSPLVRDQKRVQLILNILDRTNYDLVRNGIGTIALKAKDTLESQVAESVSDGMSFGSGELLDMARSAGEQRDKQFKKQMESIVKQLEGMEYNDALVYSSMFEDLVQLNRDTKAVDFVGYLSQYVSAIICQMFGVPARLFDLNKTVSNIGTHSIIDNAMKNNIIPMRDNFLGQCMRVLETATGCKHVHFDSYEFTNNYNYKNDENILNVYERLKEIDPVKAEQYLEKNLIV